MLKRHLETAWQQAPAFTPPPVQKLTLHQLKQAERIRKQIEALRKELAQLVSPAAKP